MTPEALRRQYRELLLGGIVPFWKRCGVDREYGGVLTCMQEDGTRLSADKYIWSQARWLWVCSALYNRIEKRPVFLDWARETIGFLLAHARDESGRFVYRTTRTGEIVEGATSIYSDCFAIYGISEYCRAVQDDALLALARQIFERVGSRVECPDFAETAPYKLPPGRRNHGVPMILTEVAGELAETTGEPAIRAAADQYAARIMDRFVRPERRCLLEFLDRNYREVPAPEGTFVMPGHAIESMWFVLHRALRRGDRDLIGRAIEVIRWHLELGWDKDFGGLFLGIDVEGNRPALPFSECKLWWPHTEALYALLLARELSGERWCQEWYGLIHEWAFAHFAMPEVGEWRQRLDRKGKPIEETVALPVKDPFHLPRSIILILQLLESQQPL